MRNKEKKQQNSGESRRKLNVIPLQIGTVNGTDGFSEAKGARTSAGCKKELV